MLMNRYIIIIKAKLDTKIFIMIKFKITEIVLNEVLYTPYEFEFIWIISEIFEDNSSFNKHLARTLYISTNVLFEHNNCIII